MIDFSVLRQDFPKATKVALVTDSNVERLYGDATVRALEATGLRVERIVFPAGEASKTIETYAELVRGLAVLEFSRTDFAVGFGGGVVTDLTGFAAATYLRGIGWAAVPTTLLGMVDASVGGKTGADLPEGKNLVGAFWKPVRVLRDAAYLETLDERERMNGIAEMIKTAVLFDPTLFEALRTLAAACGEGGCPLPPADLIERCVAWKERIVAEDFREGGRRKLLNLGHTFGHAIEHASHFAVSHGEAVAMGMRLVGGKVPEIGALLDAFGFPVLSRDDPHYTAERLLAPLAHDKKRSGDTVTLVIPHAVGDCRLEDVRLEDLRFAANMV